MNETQLKTFEEQNYPIVRRVLVAMPPVCEGEPIWSFTDLIKGLNPGHALHRARWNWGGALSIVDLGDAADPMPEQCDNCEDHRATHCEDCGVCDPTEVEHPDHCPVSAGRLARRAAGGWGA